eukprot:m.33559 g.33559  ORF g.33559 m.33559 type:complete len:236 (-) comp12240_c0_seq1:44-751(-)
MDSPLRFSQIKLLYSRLKTMVQSTLQNGEAKFTKRRLLQDVRYLGVQAESCQDVDDEALQLTILDFVAKSSSDLDHQVQQTQASELRQRRKIVTEHYADNSRSGETDNKEARAKSSVDKHEGDTLLERSGLRSALLDNQTSSLSPEELKDELTKDMLGLAQQMKHQAATTNELLLTGNQDVDAAIEEADKSTHNLTAALSIIGDQLDRHGGLWAWVLMLFALVMFVVMVIFLKFV